MSGNELPVVTLTGHRPGTKLNEEPVLESLLEIFSTLLAESDVKFIFGGADGADRLGARAAHRLKAPYTLYVPQKYYEHYRPKGEWWRNLIWEAQHIEWIGDPSEPFHVGNNFARNTRMVEDSTIGIVVGYKHPFDLVKLKKGGTVHCAKEMKRLGLDGIWVNSLTGECEAFQWG